MARWFDLEPFDADSFESAKHRFTYVMDLPVPAAEVWAGLVAETPLAWCRLLHDGKYTSPRPFGVGTTREVGVGVGRGLLKLREQFFRWEEGRRHSFSVVQMNVPTFRRFGEDYLVEDTAAGCRFTWSFALDTPSKLGPLGLGIVGPNIGIFKSLVHDTRRHFG
jgi:hypothetical protein